MERQPAEGGRDQGGSYPTEAQSIPVGGNLRAPALGGGVDLKVGPISTKFEEEDEESDEDSEEEEEEEESVEKVSLYHRVCDCILFFTIFYPFSLLFISLPLSFSG